MTCEGLQGRIAYDRSYMTKGIPLTVNQGLRSDDH